MTITTSAGRAIRIDHETMGTLEYAGITVDVIDDDIDKLVSGTLDAYRLIDLCRNGGEEYEAEWGDYVAECVRHADNELLAKQAANTALVGD